MERKLTAKDKAYLKEKAKYRHWINQLEDEVRNQNKTIMELNQKIDELEGIIISKDEWIARLLELTELTPNQVENYLHEIHYHHENEKELVNTLHHLKKYFQPEEHV